MFTQFSKKKVKGVGGEMVSAYRSEGCILFKYDVSCKAYVYHWTDVSLSKRGVDYFAAAVEQIEDDQFYCEVMG